MAEKPDNINPDNINPDNINDVEEFSPYKLLTNFSTSRVGPCLLLAVLLHVLVIGGTSYSFIYKWIVPNQKSASSDTEGEKGESSETSDSSEKDTPKESSSEKDADKGKTGTEKGDESKTAKTSGEEAPVIKKMTEKPKEGETPEEPDSLGISLEDTNR